VVFASDRGHANDYDLYLYDLQTKTFVTLSAETNTTATERHPSTNFSTDRIAFQSDRTGSQGGMDIYLLTRSTGHVSSSGSSATADMQPWIVWQ
jgi:Tol biopolymer transport system component